MDENSESTDTGAGHPEQDVKIKRVAIPDKVKAQLWVAAGGRCEYSCCNAPLDRNVLTKESVFLAEHAHIIGSSKDGPRGDAELSAKLAKDVENLMLLCARCHTTIDRLADKYDPALLRQMKRRHEERIQRFYAIDETKPSVLVMLRHSIKKTHAPQFTVRDAQAALLANSGYCRWPADQAIELNYDTKVAREDDPAYWSEVARQMEEEFQRQLQMLPRDAGPAHFSILAFAPMPLNMQLGALIGNKTEASTFQWNRTAENWRFPQARQFERQRIVFDDVPVLTGPQELALAVSLSGEINMDAVGVAVPGVPTVRLGVPNPTPALVEDEEDILHFRTTLTAFMAQVRNKGYKRLHVFPAMPLSLAVEFGRQLLPKVDPAVGVWDMQDGRFIYTMDLRR